MTSPAVAGAVVLVCSDICSAFVFRWDPEPDADARFPDGMTLWQVSPNVSCPARRWSGRGYADRSDYAFGPG